MMAIAIVAHEGIAVRIVGAVPVQARFDMIAAAISAPVAAGIAPVVATERNG